MDLLDSNNEQHEHADSESIQKMDWNSMVERCKKKDIQLNLAGEVGIKLHEQLLESQAHMDEMRLLHESQVEKMIQEIYELKSKLEKMEKYTEEQKQDLKQSIDECNKTKERVQNESNQEINLLKKTNMAKVVELDQVLLRERQLNDNIIQLSEKNAQLLAERQKKWEIQNVSCSEEIFCLNENNASLQEEVEICNNELIKFRNKNEMLTLALHTKTKELNDKELELEGAEIKSTGYFNHLQKSREETKEALAEVDALKVQLNQGGYLKVGNSLFGEVEDERLVMERKLKTMEVKCESQQKAYAFLKSQHFSLKSQVAALLALHTGKADSDHIDNLERALSQVKAENTQLVNKLKSIKINEDQNIADFKQLGTLPQLEGNKDMVEFLLIKLENSGAEIKKLSEELDCIHMVKMAESDKLLTAEEKLHDIGVLAEKYKNANMKLRLRLEETKNKLEAESQKRILVEKKFNYDSTNDVELIGVSSNILKIKPTLPHTLTKAKSKPGKRLNAFEQGNKPESCDIFSTKVNWDDVLKKLGENDDKNNANKNTIPNEEKCTQHKSEISNKHESIGKESKKSTPKDRKVSFKNVDEIMPSTQKQNDDVDVSSLADANKNALEVNQAQPFDTNEVDEILPLSHKQNDSIMVEVSRNELKESKPMQLSTDKSNHQESNKENSCKTTSSSVKSAGEGNNRDINQALQDAPCNVQ